MEVHPPHHRIDGWRDALVHLALITVGLLIALGLEGAVEWLHHRHQASETRAALAREMDRNREHMKENLDVWRREIVAYKSNLEAFRRLKSHPGQAADASSPAIYWRHYFDFIEESAWKTAQETGVTAYMPRDEVQALHSRYELLDEFWRRQLLVWESVNRVKEYGYGDSDLSRMPPGQIERQVALSSEVLADMFQVGSWMYVLSQREPQFPGPSIDELYAMEVAPPNESARMRSLRNDPRAWSRPEKLPEPTSLK